VEDEPALCVFGATVAAISHEIFVSLNAFPNLSGVEETTAGQAYL
jgi:hypothetical protein